MPKLRPSALSLKTELLIVRAFCLAMIALCAFGAYAFWPSGDHDPKVVMASMFIALSAAPILLLAQTFFEE